jgi:hypothetical protein
MKHLRMDFEQAAAMAIWQERVDLYAGLSEVAAWELHLQEVRSRLAFGSAPEREVIYVQGRLDQARGQAPITARQ